MVRYNRYMMQLIISTRIANITIVSYMPIITSTISAPAPLIDPMLTCGGRDVHAGRVGAAQYRRHRAS